MRTSPDFAANPIGTFFDPARVYDKFKAGADFKTSATIHPRRRLSARPDSSPHRPADAVNATPHMTTHMVDGETDVLIVGAGPVGLAAAIELGQRGVRCIVVERNDRVGYSPRAKTTNVRTREHLRRWGIADALRQASPISPDRPSTVVFATRMNGPALARFENALNGSRVRNNLYSEEAQWVPQYVLEDVLRRCAQSLPGVTIHFETVFVSFDQTADGVVAIGCAIVRRNRTATIRSRLSDRRRRRAQLPFATPSAQRWSATGLFAQLQHHLSSARSRRPANSRAGHHVLDDQRGSAFAARADGRGRLVVLHGHQAPGRVDPATSTPPISSAAAPGCAISPSRLSAPTCGSRIAWSRIAIRAAGVSCRRRLPSASAVRRLRHEYGDRRRGRSRLEDGGASRRLGRRRSASRAMNWSGARFMSEPSPRPSINYGSARNQLVRPGLEAPGLVGEATRQEVADIIEATKVREFKTLGIVLGMRYANSPIIVADGSEPPPTISCCMFRRRIRDVLRRIFGWPTVRRSTIISERVHAPDH